MRGTSKINLYAMSTEEIFLLERKGIKHNNKFAKF